MAEEDILFGKHRHLFGGIEPSNMTKFTARMDRYTGQVVIEAELPPDTIVDGQMLCTVGGAVIRKRLDNFPEDEFDGEELIDIKESTVIYDTDVDVDGTYYYAAFPYTNQGVYRRSKVNRAVVNEPPLTEKFYLEREYDSNNNSVAVKMTVELQTEYVGAYIRKSSTHYPVDENDGEFVSEISSSGVYRDTDVVANAMYYYAIFPYTASGVIGRSEKNRAYCIPRNCEYYFGYDIDLNNPDPAARVSYPIDVDNYEYDQAFMDYTNKVFNYGDWPSEAGDKFMPKPCMLTYGGVVDHYLDPGDYTKQSDGVTASRVRDPAFEGNAMMEWPKIYTKREEINGVYKFRCSDVKYDDTWECWCNYDKNDNEIDHFYTSIYTCSGYGGKLRSISKLYHTPYNKWNGGATDTTSSSTMTFTETIGYAQLNGDDWYIDVLADRLLIQDLLVMMAKTTNCQTAYGFGDAASGSSSSDATLRSGECDLQGMFYGYSSEYSPVKVFGMEHWWGNYGRWLAGLIGIGQKWGLKFKVTRGMKDGTTVSDYNTDGSGYYDYIKPIKNSNISNDITGYIAKCETTPFGRIPITDNGSSTTYECDLMYIQYSYSTKIALTGGNYGSGLSAGPFMVNFNNGANSVVSGTITGLSCKPSK